MLVWLAEYLVKYHTFFNVFSYLTFRAIVGLLTALIIALWMGPHLIAWLQKMQIGQVVRNEGPESHFSKRGTPTMGGIMILFFLLLIQQDRVCQVRLSVPLNLAEYPLMSPLPTRLTHLRLTHWQYYGDQVKVG